MAVVGAWLDDDIGEDSGSAYLFDLCPWELTGDGRIDSSDLGVMISEFGVNESIADTNGDGVVDAADLGQLITRFGDTCP